MARRAADRQGVSSQSAVAAAGSLALAIPDANVSQEEYDVEQLRSGAKGAESFVAQGREFEAQGDFLRSVQAYMKVCLRA